MDLLDSQLGNETQTSRLLPFDQLTFRRSGPRLVVRRGLRRSVVQKDFGKLCKMEIVLSYVLV